MYIYNAELEDDGPNMMDDRTGRKMVLGWRLFGRSCRFSSPTVWSVTFHAVKNISNHVRPL